MQLLRVVHRYLCMLPFHLMFNVMKRLFHNTGRNWRRGWFILDNFFFRMLIFFQIVWSLLFNDIRKRSWKFWFFVGGFLFLFGFALLVLLIKLSNQIKNVQYFILYLVVFNGKNILCRFNICILKYQLWNIFNKFINTFQAIDQNALAFFIIYIMHYCR